MKYLLLIADVTADWYEAEECRGEAEHIWYVANRITSNTEELAKEALGELRRNLIALQEELERQKLEDFDERHLYEWFAEEDEDHEEDEDEYDILGQTIGKLKTFHQAEYRLWGSEANVRRRFEEWDATVAAARIARKEPATDPAAAKQKEEEAAMSTVKQTEEEAATAAAKQEDEEAAAAAAKKTQEETAAALQSVPTIEVSASPKSASCPT